MKKTALCALCAILLIATVFGISTSASFGSGVEVIAEGTELIKTGLSGQKIRFSDSDFKCALIISDFDKLTIKTLPKSSCGTLMLAGRRVNENQTIKRKNIASLVFVPSSKDVTECNFTFTIDDVGGGAEFNCTLKFVEKVNMAPSIENDTESVFTQGDISLYERLYAKDPEGDAISYIVVSYPEYGTVELLDGGRYKYTPYDGYIGEDKFAYVVRDEYGNYTKPAYVKIEVIERMSDVEYTDMKDSEHEGAAVALTAMGIMSGDRIGDGVYFRPDESVTRAEFVAMAMKAYGVRADSSLTTSYFDDNADIPAALVGYVATAQRLGIVNGTFASGSLLFRPNDVITRYEAAKIMSELIGKEATGVSEVFADIDTVPVWARPGVYSMYSLGIFNSSDGKIYGNAAVSRAECASYLYRMCLVAEGK